jgi:hypothetical protein
MAHQLQLNRETLRRLDGNDLAALHAGGVNSLGCPPPASLTLCDTGTCGTQTIKTSITGGAPTRTSGG